MFTEKKERFVLSTRRNNKTAELVKSKAVYEKSTSIELIKATNFDGGGDLLSPKKLKCMYNWLKN